MNAEPLNAHSHEPDVFARLGISSGEEDATPLRLAELAVSQARLRKMAFRQAETVPTAFHLVIRDLDADAFTWDAHFYPPLRESNEPMSAAERLGCMVMRHFEQLLRQAVAAGAEAENDVGLAPPAKRGGDRKPRRRAEASPC